MRPAWTVESTLVSRSVSSVIFLNPKALFIWDQWNIIALRIRTQLPTVLRVPTPVSQVDPYLVAQAILWGEEDVPPVNGLVSTIHHKEHLYKKLLQTMGVL